MGKFKDLLGMLPGLGAYAGEMDVDESEISHVEAIIQSMTRKERERPAVLNTQRRDRIARGSGTDRTTVDDLIRQFNTMKKVMDQMGTVGGGKGPLGKIKSMVNAKRQLADLPGMMNRLAEADPEVAAMRKNQQKNVRSGPSKEEIRKRRKAQRKARRQGRRR
jgi:signal recognition particle GTPase